MPTLRTLLAAGVVSLAAVAATADAATPSASGGGFSRDGSGRKATKTSLSLQAVDNGLNDSGSAELRVSKPGVSDVITRITLTCVTVSGTTAYASGHDSANQQYLLKVVDNGEPGRRDTFGVAKSTTPASVLPVPLPLPVPAVSNCGASDVAGKTLTGGNFQVRS